MAETTLTVAARPAGFDVDVRSAGIASMLPGLFHGWPECTQVVVTIATRDPVTFARTEIEAYADTKGAERLAAVGLIQRRWMGALDGARAILADITWLCLPHLDAVDATFAEIAEHAGQPTVIKAAADSLARVSVRLQRTDLPTPQSSLVGDVRNLLADAARHSELLARATLRKDRPQTGKEAADVRRSLLWS